MNTATKAKTKRKARPADRKYALVLARRYFERGPYPMEIEGQTYTTPADGDMLAIALLLFAKHGTFETPPARDVQVLQMRGHVRRLCEVQEISVEDAIGKTAEDYDVSEQKVRDAVYGRKRKT